MIIDKGKQKEDIVQDEEVLYKPYDISTSSSSEMSFLDIQMIQNKISNLEKALKTL